MARALDIATHESGKATGYIKNKWDSFISYNENSLVEAGILGAPLACGGLINITGLQHLHNGAIWQLYSQVQDQQEQLTALTGQLQSLQEGK